MLMNNISLGNFNVGDNYPCYIIAEIGNLFKNFDEAKKLIDSALSVGVNAIKFQTHIADAESSIHEPFRVKFSKQDTTRYEYWHRMEFTLDQWRGLKTHCDEVGLEFISSPFSNAAVDLLEKVGVKRYKVGSGEVNNFVLLEKISYILQKKQNVIFFEYRINFFK